MNRTIIYQGLRKTSPLGFVILVASLMLAIQSPLLANTYNVTSTTDHPITGGGITVNGSNGVISGGSGNGLVTIRSAAAAANTIAAGPHTINIPAGTYNLTIAGTGEGLFPAVVGIGDIDITANNVTIHGAGMNTTIIHQTTNIDRLFDVNVNFIGSFVFTMDNLTLSGGREQTGNGGGAVFTGSNNNLGTITFTNVKFDDNQSFQAAGFNGSGFGGGGLQHQGGDLVLSGCIFNNNTAAKSGGALNACGFRDLPISPPIVYSTMTVTNCTFTNNTSTNGASGGGAIDFFGMNLSSSTVNVSGCSFTNNHANTSSGGAIVNESIDLTVTKCTFLNNGGINGGAVYVGGGNGTTVSFCRLVGNTASGTGSGFSGTGATLTGNNNWWGVNTLPAGTVTGSAVATNWLQLRSSATPTPICPTSFGLGNTSTVTSSFLTRSDNAPVSASNLDVLIGLPITFTPTLGTLSVTNSTIPASCTLTTVFTSNGTPGNGGVDADVDNIPAGDAFAKANIVINAPAAISTQPSNSTVCLNDNTSFTVVATGTAPLSYQWRRGTTNLSNGPTGNGSTLSGVTTATLTITNAKTTDVASDYNVVVSNSCAIVTSSNRSLTVNLPSTAPSSISGTTLYCNPGSTTLTAVGGTLGTNANYQWGTGSVVGTNPIGGATNISINISPTTTTTYWVRIENTASPCVATTGGVTQVVTVNQPSSAPTSITGTTTICNPGTTTLTAAGGTLGTSANYQWGTGSVIGANPIGGATNITLNVSPTTTTTYWVRIENTASPCTAITGGVTQVVTVNNPSIAPSGISGTTLYCNPGSTTLTATGGTLGTNANYQWGTGSVAGTNPIGGATNITLNVSPTSTTTYWVRIENTASPCTGTTAGVTQVVTVNQPSVAPTSITGTTTICNGSSTTLTAAGGTLGTGANYQWGTGAVVGVNPIGSAINSTLIVSPSVNTTYWVRIENTVAPCTGTTGGVAQAVTVFNPSVAPTGISGITTICNAGSTTLTATGGTLGTNANYQWGTGAVVGTSPLTGETNSTINVSPAGSTTYWVRIENTTAPCASNTSGVTQVVTVQPQLTPSISGNLTFCSGGSTMLDAGSGYSAYSWSTSAITQTISVNTAGTFTVTVSDAVGCTGTASATTVVNQSPVIGACPADINQCSNPVATWIDPIATGSPSPTVVCSPASGSTFATGTTPVTCTATNSCGSSNCSFNVTITAAPVCQNGGTVNVNCGCDCPPGYSGVFCEIQNCTPPVIGACPSNITQCGNPVATWTDPSATGTTPTVVCSPASGSSFAAGTTTVTCTATNACGTDACSFTVTVALAPPATNLQFPTVPAYACSGNNLTASTSAVTFATTYTWDGPAGTTFNSSGNPYSSGSTLVNVTYGPPNGSGYNICVQGSNACGTTTRRCSFVRGTVNVPGTIAPANSRTIECANTSANYSITSVGGATSYTWSITGDATVIGSGTNATVNFGAAWISGNLCVTANTPCYSSAQRCMSLSNGIALPGAIIGATTICPGSSVTYSVPATGGAATYNWILPPNSTGSSGTNSILVNFLSGFTFGDIKVSITSICGVTSVQQIKTILSGLPPAPASISGNAAGLCNQTVVYNCPNVSGATGYTWTTSGGTINSGQGSTSINVTFGPLINGNVCVTADNACGSSSPRCIPVKGSPTITGNITYTPGTICANQSGVDFQVNAAFGTTTYNWIFPAGVTPVLDLGNEQIVNWGTNSGVVSVTAANACGNTTKSTTITLGCREIDPETELTYNTVSVYPNPAHDRINIQFNAVKKTNYTLNLLDLSGRILNTKNLIAQKGMNTSEMILIKFAKGVYIVELKSDLINKQVRIVIE